MRSIALQQVSSKFARDNAARTLEHPVALRIIAKYAPEVAKRLEVSCPTGRVYVWGAKLERSHQTVKMIGRNSLVLFRRRNTVYKRGIVIETTNNEELANALWGRDVDGETWSNIFFFAKITDMNRPAARVNENLGRSADDHWQGLVVLPIKDTEKARAFFERELSAL
ncbi:MAG: hypothetical protein M0015_15025 [Betaproteobacteria bacterium]|nr:hypothetical protein [Betaproteobacteria bacterium]